MLGLIIAWLFIAFGSVMGMLCIIRGIPKAMKGDTAFRGMKLIKDMNAFRVPPGGISGVELIALGVFLELATLLYYYAAF